jgi:hypothetical protein
MANLCWSGREGAPLVSITQWRMNVARNKGWNMLRARHSKKMTKSRPMIDRPVAALAANEKKAGASPGQWFAGGTWVGSRRRRLKGERANGGGYPVS